MKLTYPQWVNCEARQRIPNKNWNTQYNNYSYRNNNGMCILAIIKLIKNKHILFM